MNSATVEQKIRAELSRREIALALTACTRRKWELQHVAVAVGVGLVDHISALDMVYAHDPGLLDTAIAEYDDLIGILATLLR